MRRPPPRQDRRFSSIIDTTTDPTTRGRAMKINLSSVFVDDQDAALDFYTKTLGFLLKTETPAGEYRWLTLVSPDEHEGPELVLEPSNHPAVGPFKAALVADGIPFTSFGVDDVRREHE